MVPGGSPSFATAVQSPSRKCSSIPDCRGAKEERASPSGIGQNVWNNQKDLPRGCKVDRPTSGKIPGPGSRVFPHPMPTLPRPARPPTLRSRAPGLSMRLCYSLAPPRCDLRRGWGGGCVSHCSLRPFALLQPVRTTVYSPGAGEFPSTLHTGLPLGARNPPSHPAAKETSLILERPAGKVGVGLWTRLRRWKGVEAGAGERRGLRSSESQEKHPWSMI